MKITILESAYIRQQGEPALSLLLDLDGQQYPATLYAEIKPTLLRHGLVFLGAAFSERVLPIEVEGITLKGFVRDPPLLLLYVAFGLEVYYGRFQEGEARLTPDRNEVKELGDRLSALLD